MEKSVESKQDISKYYRQSKLYFSKFDNGCELDEEGWYSVTHELIAAHIAQRCKCRVVVDAFCGVGGNTIQFAKVCDRVIAVDIDESRLKLAKKNAKVYGVDHKIEFLQGDFFELAPKIAERNNVDVVFMAPPWGGPDYWQKPVFDLEKDMPFPMSKAFRAAQLITPHVALFLPFNADPAEVSKLSINASNFTESSSNTNCAVTGDDDKPKFNVQHVVAMSEHRDGMDCTSRDTSYLSTANVTRFMPEVTTWSPTDIDLRLYIPSTSVKQHNIIEIGEKRSFSKRTEAKAEQSSETKEALPNAGDAASSETTLKSAVNSEGNVLSSAPSLDLGQFEPSSLVLKSDDKAKEALEWLLSKPGSEVVSAVPFLSERLLDLAAKAGDIPGSRLWVTDDSSHAQGKATHVHQSYDALSIDVLAEHISAVQFLAFLNHLTAFSRVEQYIVQSTEWSDETKKKSDILLLKFADDAARLEAEYTKTLHLSSLILIPNDDELARLINRNVFVLSRAKSQVNDGKSKRARIEEAKTQSRRKKRSKNQKWSVPEVIGTHHLYPSRTMHFATGEATWAHVLAALYKSPLLRRIRHSLWLNQLWSIHRETLIRMGALIKPIRRNESDVSEFSQIGLLPPRLPKRIPRMPLEAASLLLCPCTPSNATSRNLNTDTHIAIEEVVINHVKQSTCDWKEDIILCEAEMAASNGQPKAMLAYFGALVGF